MFARSMPEQVPHVTELLTTVCTENFALNCVCGIKSDEASIHRIRVILQLLLKPLPAAVKMLPTGHILIVGRTTTQQFKERLNRGVDMQSVSQVIVVSLVR